MCPVNWVTGGTEALHQLAHVINGCGGIANICYYNEKSYAIDAATPLPFKIYNIKKTTKISDSSDSAIIFPESKTIWIDEFKSLKKYIWWLSVNNSDRTSKHYFKREDITHLYQSAYAKDYLIKNGVKNISPLSDYTCLPSIKQHKNRLGIAINYTKIHPSYQPIINAIKENFEVTELKNLSKWKVLKLFSTVDLYIDFGGFPGKDRMPREAALMGANVVLSNLGSAGYEKDFPGLKDYKFSADEKGLIMKQIHRIFNEPLNEKSQEVFNNFKKSLKSEFEIFVNEVDDIFYLNRKNQILPSKKNRQLILYLDNLLYSYGLYGNAKLASRNKVIFYYKKVVRKLISLILA